MSENNLRSEMLICFRNGNCCFGRVTWSIHCSHGTSQQVLYILVHGIDVNDR
jgi:hypothetical protein